jgi:replicative DNA helicase
MFDDETDDAGDWQARVQSARLTELMLGAAMRSPELAQTLIACGFDDEDMPEAPHRAIWKAVWKAHTRGKVVDHNLVEADIVTAGMDAEKAREFILACRRDIDEPESPKIVAYVEEVKRRVALRRIAKLGRELILKADEPDVAPGPIVATSTQELDAILRGAAVIRAAHGEELERLAMAAFDEQAAVRYIPIGVSAIDDEVGGVVRGGITVIAAQKKIGKTTLAKRNLLFVARTEVCLHISLEAKTSEIAEGLAEMRAGVLLPFDKRHMTVVDRTRYTKAAGEVSSMPIFVEKMTYPTAEEVAALIYAHVRKHEVTFVQIDFIQNMQRSTTFKSDEQNHAHMARVICACADNCPNTAFVCFSQMKNDEDGKGGKIERDDPVPNTQEWSRLAYLVCDMKRNSKSADEKMRNLTQFRLTHNRPTGQTRETYFSYIKHQRRMHEVTSDGHPLVSRRPRGELGDHGWGDT